MADFEISPAMTVPATSDEGTECSPEIQPIKKKRNLPGMPDPEAEVIALSPTTLLATNRFVCEICSKGFQRDQNLQLHRRGHNLPWKLKARDGKEIRKRVYVCPEKSCIHHDPVRALGDLTGIKKHFSRKHGEKKWNCGRCAKKYAVHSDWKAHMKTCGTKEYKCNCGTIFSRKDSFITHRAYCDVLPQENMISQSQNMPVINSDHLQDVNKEEAAVLSPLYSPLPPSLTPSTSVLSPTTSVHSPDSPENVTRILHHQKGAVAAAEAAEICLASASGCSTTSDNNNSTDCTDEFASIFASSSVLPLSQSSPASYSDMICGVTPSLFPPPDQTIHHQHHRQCVQAQQPALSATALLQTAAQMGATSSNTSFLHAPTTLDFLGLGVGGFSGGYSEFWSSIGAGVSFVGVNSVHSKDWDISGDKNLALL